MQHKHWKKSMQKRGKLSEQYIQQQIAKNRFCPFFFASYLNISLQNNKQIGWKVK